MSSSQSVLLINCGMPQDTYLGFSPAMNKFLSNYFFRLRLPKKQLGILYLTTSLINAGVNCDSLDLETCIPSKREKIVRKIVKKYDYVGLSCNTTSYPEAIRLAEVVKETNPSAKTVLGGPHVTFTYNETLRNKNVDYIIRGEAEKSLVDLVLGKEKSSIKGLCYKNGKKLVLSSPTLIENLDELPLPIRDKLRPLHCKYSETEIVMLSRGCNNACSFCSSTRMFPKLRFRSVQNVSNEIEALVENKTNDLFLLMANFTSLSSYSKKILEEITERNLDIKQMFVEACIDTTDFDILDAFKKAGGTRINFGVESLNPSSLIYMNKTRDPQRYASRVMRLLKYCKKIGLQTSCYYILFPAVKKRLVFKEISLLKRNCDLVILELLTPFPGTLEWERLKNQVIDDFSLFDLSHVVIKNFGLSEQDVRDIGNYAIDSRLELLSNFRYFFETKVLRLA